LVITSIVCLEINFRAIIPPTAMVARIAIKSSGTAGELGGVGGGESFDGGERPDAGGKPGADGDGVGGGGGSIQFPSASLA
jgi:hypothetical protein